MFNSVPIKIRNITKVPVKKFKEQLDKFLELIPDEPNVEGFTPSTCNQYFAAPSNSILNQGLPPYPLYTIHAAAKSIVPLQVYH